jgi:hypothetical protein
MKETIRIFGPFAYMILFDEKGDVTHEDVYVGKREFRWLFWRIYRRVQ